LGSFPISAESDRGSVGRVGDLAGFAMTGEAGLETRGKGGFSGPDARGIEPRLLASERRGGRSGKPNLQRSSRG
jgi:hypothetical protein